MTRQRVTFEAAYRNKHRGHGQAQLLYSSWAGTKYGRWSWPAQIYPVGAKHQLIRIKAAPRDS